MSNLSDYQYEIVCKALEKALETKELRVSRSNKQYIHQLFRSYMSSCPANKNVCHSCLGTGYNETEDRWIDPYLTVRREI